jgi:glycosyltransferase involved in cell wall biosynthesis
MKPLRAVHCPVNMGGIPMVNVEALRRQGVDARLVLFKPPRLRAERVDLILNLPDGLLRRQLKQWPALARLLPGTDVFHFYFGQTLVPKRLQVPILRALGKPFVHHFLGSDIRGKTPEELAYARAADARIVGSYDAIRWVPDADVIPPGIDLGRITPAPPSDARRPRVVHAPSSRRRKGTEHVVAACAELDVELDVVEGVRHAEAVERYRAADIVVDQLNAGWYGVFAIEAMALGKPVLTYLHDEATERSEKAFGVRVPIVSATKETLADRLRPLVESPEERRRIGAESRAYVERVHDIDRVGAQLLAVYERIGLRVTGSRGAPGGQDAPPAPEAARDGA